MPFSRIKMLSLYTCHMLIYLPFKFLNRASYFDLSVFVNGSLSADFKFHSFQLPTWLYVVLVHVGSNYTSGTCSRYDVFGVGIGYKIPPINRRARHNIASTLDIRFSFQWTMFLRFISYFAKGQTLTAIYFTKLKSTSTWFGALIIRQMR